eukprot:542172_1
MTNGRWVIYAIIIVCVAILLHIYKYNTLWMSIVILYHPNSYYLQQMLYYGLTADVFDGDSDYDWNCGFNNPLLSLRKVCKSILFQNVSIKHIKRLIIENAYPNSSSIINHNMLNCLLKDCKLLNNSVIQNLITDMDKLSHFLQSNCRHDIYINDIKNDEKIVVIGGSSSGLITTLAAFHSGVNINNIIVIEKRSSYLRDIWFDLYDKPFYIGKELLNNNFAFNTQNSEKYIETAENMEIYVMRAQILERFLAKIVYLIGIDIKYNHKVENIEFDKINNKY